MIIQPKATLRGTATQCQILSVVYRPDGTAKADIELHDAGGAIIDGITVEATAQQTAAWSDDAAFFAVLAANAGLTPA